MAVITEINGVSTSGTSGVNNIFGSGGGSSPVTTTPTILIGSSTTYGSNTLLVSNSLSYTEPLFYLTVEQPDGTEIVSELTEWDINLNSGFYAFNWSDATSVTGTFTARVRVAEVGNFQTSLEATATYTKERASFKYIRIQACTSNGTIANGHLGIEDFQLFDATNATGNQFTGAGNGTYMTSNTSNPDFTISAGHNASGYEPWEAFTNGVGIGNAWWSLSSPSASANNLTIQFNDQTDNASSQYVTDADFPNILSIRTKDYSGSSATHYKILVSQTGAFAGEETQYGGINTTNGQYAINNV